MSLINDTSLIGFWPLNEASGAPVFRNYSHSYGIKPSGISFDLHVHQAIDETAALALSEWPGTTAIFDQASGTLYRGLQLHGTYQSATKPGRHSKVLTIGMGTPATRDITIAPALAQSGFTFGFWVLPQSNGYDEYIDGATDDGTRQQGFGNAIMGRNSLGGTTNDEYGIWLGVSGFIQGGAQFGSTREGGPHLLTGYLYITGADADNPFTSTSAEILETPIESGAYVHLTASYRFLGATQEVVLYKNGRVAASGSTDRVLTRLSTPAANLFDEARWTIGGSLEDAAADIDRYSLANGWNHLVSGAYLFNRVLHEGEVLDMHTQGGLQPSLGIELNAIPIQIDDPLLLAYYPCAQVGYADVSRHHRPLMGPLDEGDRSIIGVTSGPFGFGGIYNSDDLNYFVATSGLTFDLAQSAGGFTVAARYMHPSVRTYIANMLVSIGSTDDILTPVVTNSTLGWHVARDTQGGNDKLFLRAFPLGANTPVTTLTAVDGLQMDSVVGHFAVVYDDATFGLSLYQNGELQSSGTLATSLQTHMLHLAGSGFPLMFLNGVLDQDPETVDGNAALNNALFDIAIVGRPMLPTEIRGLAASGINLSSLMRTPHDPRLCGYWPCSDYDGDDTLVEDRASLWQFMPGHLHLSESDLKWDVLNNSDTRGPWLRIRYADVVRTLPPELASFGSLGITSGIFTPVGCSPGSLVPVVGGVNLVMSSIANYPIRYKPNTEDNDLPCNHILAEWLVGFELTPSGTIPPSTELATTTPFNSLVFQYGNNTSNLRAYLTNIAHVVGQAPGSSGVSLAFMCNEAGTIAPLASGNIPFGVPSPILFHLKFHDPYNAEDTGVTATIGVNLHINGNLVGGRKIFSNVVGQGFWSNLTPASTGDAHNIQFGGQAVSTLDPNTQIALDVGLGDNYLREIFIARGVFSGDDITYFATSGIGGVTNLQGFNSTGSQSTTQVTIADDNLKGYWRFNGQPSGEMDLSLFNNDLISLAKEAIEDGVFGSANVAAAYNLRWFPGPLRNSDLGVQASGITYAGDTNGLTTNLIAPYVASGVDFHEPSGGFSIGFLHCKRGVVASNDADVLIAYGTVPSDVDGVSVTPIIYPNASWAIVTDEDESIKMVVSSASLMNLDDVLNVASSGQIVVGVHNQNPPYDTQFYSKFKAGALATPHIDSFSAYCWTYDPNDEKVRCYLNGTLVDEQKAPSRPGLHGPFAEPADQAAKLITFFIHQEDTPWNFGSTRIDSSSYLTDVFYFDRPITEQEARYIAFNGIDSAQGTEVSGMIGGFIHGQDTGSGLIGGYTQGLETGSGMIGGYMPGGTLASGLIGCFVSGIVFADGTIGGFIHGSDIGSGIIGGYIQGANLGSGMIAGYIRGSDIGSGLIGGLIFGTIASSGTIGGFIHGSLNASGLVGGFIIGGLQNNIEFDAGFTIEAMAAEDFDAQLEIAKTISSDFDAKLIIFQNETPPIIDIIIPNQTVEGLVPPFNQYFIAQVSGTQNKTIDQVRWTFSDFSPTQTVAESGIGLYPIQHRFESSGLYIVKATAIDSDGMRSSAIRIVNAASGIDPVRISLSGIPQMGDAGLIVDFTTTINTIPPGVIISAKFLDFDDGQSTISLNPRHVYVSPGRFTPIWCTTDSRGIIWCDSLNSGNNN